MSFIIINPNTINLPSIVLQSRKGLHSDIPNEQINTPLPPYELLNARNLERQYNFVKFRTNSCGYYNCHGLTFASRRTRIYDSDCIAKMMKEDGYVQIVNLANVLPGDIIMYYRNGDPQHSGIVVNVPLAHKDFNYETLVLSKWGAYQETIHTIYDCPYSQSVDSILFYRIQSIHHGIRL